jgi:hypothetical protein
MSWGIGLVLTIGLMATPGALAQAPATPGTPEPPTVEVPPPPAPPDVNPPKPPDVDPPAPPKPVHVDPPPPPDVGVVDPPKPEKPKADPPKGDKDPQPKDDKQAPPIAAAKAKLAETQAAKPQVTTSKPAPRVHVDPKPKLLRAAPVVRSKPASSSRRSDPAVATHQVASAAVVGATSLRTVSDRTNTGHASDPRPATRHAPAIAAQASSPQPRALTLNGSRERFELTLAFALLFPALVAFMIGRTLARSNDTKDRYHL